MPKTVDLIHVRSTNAPNDQTKGVLSTCRRECFENSENEWGLVLELFSVWSFQLTYDSHDFHNPQFQQKSTGVSQL